VSSISARRFSKLIICSENFVKRVVGRTKLEDGLKKLEKLISEEVAMAGAQLLRLAHNIDNKVTGVDECVGRIDENVKVVDDKLETMADGRQHLFASRGVISDIHHLDGKTTAKEVKSIVNGVDDVKRS
jgi:hypothetical protein